jgi:hypothetical protein
MLQPDRLASTFDATLVVSLPRASKTRLEQEVADQGFEPVRQLPFLQPEDALHRRRQVIVNQAPGHPAQVRERPHMSIQEAGAITMIVQVDEVAARVHQPHQELPCLAAHAAFVDGHIEEVHLGLIAGTMNQRNVHLRCPPPLLRQIAAHRPLPNLHALFPQLAIKARRRQPVLAIQPRRPFLHQRIDPRPHDVQHRLCPIAYLHPPRLRLTQILLDGSAVQSQLTSDPPRAHPLHEVLVSYDV